MLDLLIIGGGIHGTAISHILTRTGAIDRERIRVLDPFEQPIHEWRRMTSQCGMKYLRSPGAHTIDGSFTSLFSHAKGNGMYRTKNFIEPNMRPSLTLFNDHASTVILQNDLVKLRLAGTAVEIDISESSALVETDRGRLEAAKVLFCVGHGPRRYPGKQTRHVYDEDFSIETFADSTRPVIIGGGIAAAQLALATAEQRRGSGLPPVTMLSRHTATCAQYDSDPCYIGPRCAPSFSGLQSPEEKRRVLASSRFPGSMPPDVLKALSLGIREGEIGLHVGRQTEPYLRQASFIVAATGFEPGPPLPGIISRLALLYGLPTDSAGFPIVDRRLKWHNNLYMAGSLGEQELGPPAANIIGAHLAARRLVPYFLDHKAAPTAPYLPLSRWWPKTT